MNLYAILRARLALARGSSAGGRALEERRPTSRCPTTSAGSAATCSKRAAGSVGTVCIYEASSPEAIRKHADLADLPVDEIIAVADTVIVRPDPEPVSA